MSRLFAHLIDTWCEGWLEGAKAHGVPRTRARWAHVNGFLFYGERGERYDGDPELAARAVRERWWVREYEHWFAEEKPAIEARNRELQAVDVTTLGDGALRAHAREVYDHAIATGPLHFSHRGRELSRDELRKRAADEGVELDLTLVFAGGSPASSRPSHLVGAIAAELRAARVDPASLTSLDDIRAVPEAARLLEEYLGEYGHRLLDSYDLACPTLIERPEVVVASVRAALADGRDREPVPVELPPMSDALRQLVEEARISAGTEDDDDGACIFWPSGLLRRALVEVARRRSLPDPVAIFEVDARELDALLDGHGPSNDELTKRLEQRLALAEVRPPVQLGDGAAPPWLAHPSTDTGELKGSGIGTEVVRGRACVVRSLDGDGLNDIAPGDVLIAVTTTPGYNAVMPIIAAVATETNMGHTVICARELGIPAVVGVPGLVDAVPHGATVEIDAANGVVRVID